MFSYTNYRDALRGFAMFYISQGESYRSMAILCGSKSPNFIQMIISGKRNLTPTQALKIAEAFSLADRERTYFLKLIQIEQNIDTGKILEELRSITKQEAAEAVDDQTILSRWEYALIYELASIPDLVFKPEHLKQRIKAHITLEQIEQAIAFLSRKGWIKIDENYRAEQKLIKFKVIDDCRQIDVQSNHLTNLELAKHRLNDPVSKREYRGYTVAIPQRKMPEIQELSRKYIREVKELVAGYDDPDQVIHLQLCIFELTSTLSKVE